MTAYSQGESEQNRRVVVVVAALSHEGLVKLPDAA